MAEVDPVLFLYRMMHKSYAIAVDLSVVVELCVFPLPVYMGWCDDVPLCTAAAVPTVYVHTAHREKGNHKNVQRANLLLAAHTTSTKTLGTC